MKIYTRFSPPPSPSISFSNPSMTDQSFKRECDIYHIIDAFAYNGSLPTPPPASATDFDLTLDYQSALDSINAANESFLTLPSNVREKFNNNPAGLIEFLSNESNREEAVSLGLVNPTIHPSELAE